jgi:photosystem II stability/assembly factor-like uncharacterized protein
MKKFTLTLSLIISIYSIVVAQWTSITSGTTAKLEGIHFIDSQTGICSGGFSTIRQTTDGGNTWNSLGITGYKDFSFSNSTDGFAAGPVGNSMSKTTDGGSSWTALTPPTSNSLWAVAATSSTTAYFVGTGGVIWKTTNGGASFTVLNSGTTAMITDVVFTNSTTGYISAQSSGIKKTVNSGLTWTTIYSPSSSLTEMCFVDDNIGYAVGPQGLVIKTTDAGLSWNVLTTNLTTYFQGVDFFDADNGIVVGFGGVILYTSDGGVNWILQNSGTAENLYDVRMLTETSAIVIGDNGTILKNSDILDVEDDIFLSSIELYPNPSDNQLTIGTELEISAISIIDITGKTIRSFEKNTKTVSVADLPSGIYFIKFVQDERNFTKKFVKQ